MKIPDNALPSASIEFLTGPLKGQSYSLDRQSCTIGNARDNDISIPDLSVVSHHAQIVFEDGRWSIISFAYLHINQEIEGRAQRSLIMNGDAIHLGNTTFIFRSESIQALAGQPTLEVTSNTDLIKYKPYSLLGQQVFTIGTDSSDDIAIKTHASFRAHIEYNNSRFTFVYPQPVSGTLANRLYFEGKEVKVSDQTWSKVLTHGDVYRISDEYGSFITLTYIDSPATNQTALPKLLTIPLIEPVLRIGSDTANDAVLRHSRVASYHACLQRERPGVYVVVDMDSKDGTFVNGTRIVHPHGLEPGNEIGIGPFKFIYTGTELREYDESAGIRIDAQHLIRKVKRTTLIDDVSLAIQPRHLVALVGSSGTGKSTLLDALSGMRPLKKGRVLYNGWDYYINMPVFSTRLGYVPQEDNLHRTLTVTHALSYVARLRQIDNAKARVKQVLNEVGLGEDGKKLISQLSGGQRKRVAIAMELLANPDVLFLDEPTSGLDAGLDRKMMWLLRLLADRGCTTILATHTISNIDACDEVCWLANGGRLVYFGSPDGARMVFNRSNLAEVYSMLEEQYKDENTSKKAKKPKKMKRQTLNSSNDVSGITTSLLQEPAVERKLQSRRKGSGFKQFLVLCQRYLELLKFNLLFLLLQAPIIGGVLAFLIAPTTFDPNQIAVCLTDPVRENSLILSGNCQNLVNDLATAQGKAYVAQQGMSVQAILQSHIATGSGANAQYILLILAFAAMMLGCINGCREIVKEWPIYRRERAFNLGIAPYLFSKIIVLGALCLSGSFIMIVLVQHSAPFQQGIILPAFWEISITMLLISLAGLMTGLFISSISRDSNRALIFLPMVLVPQIIFSGAVFPLDKPYLQIIGAFFPVRWALAAMGSTVGLHSDKLGADSFSYQGTLFSIYDKSTATFHLLLCWGVLTATCILLAILISIVLKSRDIRT